MTTSLCNNRTIRRLCSAALVALLLLAGTAVPAAADDHIGSIQQPIIGGEPALGTDYPFVGALTFLDEDDEPSGFCTSTLVRPQWVLTAAHCVTDDDGRVNVNLNRLRVRFGTTLANNDGDELDTVRVNRVVVHNNYDPELNEGSVRATFEDGRLVPVGEPDGTLDRDVALLRLTRPALVAPVALAGPADHHLAEPGDPVVLVGYGRPCGIQGRESCDYDGVLREGEGTILSDRQADRELNGYSCIGSCTARISYVGEHHLAITGDNTCKGDSGGPLLVEAADGSYRQVGVTSWGLGRDTRFLWWGSNNVCDASKPSVYAKTVDSELFDWVQTVASEPNAISVTVERARIVLDEGHEFYVEDSASAPELRVTLGSVGDYHQETDRETVAVPADYGDGDWVRIDRDLGIDAWGRNGFRISASVEVPFIFPGSPPTDCLTPDLPGGFGGFDGLGGFDGIGGGMDTCSIPGNTKPILPQQLHLSASESFTQADDNRRVVIRNEVGIGTLEVEVEIGNARDLPWLGGAELEWYLDDQLFEAVVAGTFVPSRVGGVHAGAAALATTQVAG